MSVPLHTADEVRDTDERIGRELRQLRDAVADRGWWMSTNYWRRENGDDRHKVTVYGDRETFGKQISEVSESLPDALDSIRDRINREDWDR